MAPAQPAQPAKNSFGGLFDLNNMKADMKKATEENAKKPPGGEMGTNLLLTSQGSMGSAGSGDPFGSAFTSAKPPATQGQMQQPVNSNFQPMAMQQPQ